jgi:hypothetical protein
MDLHNGEDAVADLSSLATPAPDGCIDVTGRGTWSTGGRIRAIVRFPRSNNQSLDDLGTFVKPADVSIICSTVNQHPAASSAAQARF